MSSNILRLNPPKNRPLTPRQQAFVTHYVQTLNASKAAREAKYTGESKVIGSQLLSNPNVKQAIQAKLQETQQSPLEIIRRVERIASGNMGDFITEDGDIDVTRTPESHDLIKRYSSTDKGQAIELHSQLEALDKLMRYHGILQQDAGNQTTINNNMLAVMAWQDVAKHENIPEDEIIKEVQAILLERGRDDTSTL